MLQFLQRRRTGIPGHQHLAPHCGIGGNGSKALRRQRQHHGVRLHGISAARADLRRDAELHIAGSPVGEDKMERWTNGNGPRQPAAGKRTQKRKIHCKFRTMGRHIVSLEVKARAQRQQRAVARESSPARAAASIQTELSSRNEGLERRSQHSLDRARLGVAMP